MAVITLTRFREVVWRIMEVIHTGVGSRDAYASKKFSPWNRMSVVKILMGPISSSCSCKSSLPKSEIFASHCFILQIWLLLSDILQTFILWSSSHGIQSFFCKGIHLNLSSV